MLSCITKPLIVHIFQILYGVCSVLNTLTTRCNSSSLSHFFFLWEEQWGFVSLTLASTYIYKMHAVLVFEQPSLLDRGILSNKM